MTGNFDTEDVGVGISKEDVVRGLLVLLHVELWLAYKLWDSKLYNRGKDHPSK